MTKAELLESIRRDRAALDAMVARVGESRLVEPALEAGWSVKDALAHIVAWEQRCLGWIRDNGASRPPSFTAESINAWNEEQYAASRDTPLPDVLAASRRSTAELIGMITSMTDEQVEAPPAWAPDTPLWWMLNANGGEHYREHVEQISRWLDGA